MRRALPVLMGVAILWGCGGGGAKSQVQFGVHGRDEVLRPLLTTTATAGDWSAELRGDEIGTIEAPHRGEPLDTPTRGTLEITVVLARPGEAPMASTTVALEIREDWLWGVDVHLSDQNPTQGCFGCLGHEAVAVPDDLIPEVADSLFVVWGGNSISSPVVY